MGQSDCLSFKTFDVMQLLNQILIKHMDLGIWEKDTYCIKRDCISHSEIMSTFLKFDSLHSSCMKTVIESGILSFLEGCSIQIMGIHSLIFSLPVGIHSLIFSLPEDNYAKGELLWLHVVSFSPEVRRLSVVHSQLQTTPETTETRNIQTLSEASEHSAQGGTKIVKSYSLELLS